MCLYNDKPINSLSADWREVHHNRPTNFDMEHEALQVIANGTNGYNETIELSFYGENGKYIGDVIIRLDNWRFEIDACGHQGDMEEDSRQDMESDQTWSFKMNRDENGDHRLRAHCNHNLAFDFTISEDNCMDWGWTGSWDTDIHQLGFADTDTASDFFRHRPHLDTGINIAASDSRT